MKTLTLFVLLALIACKKEQDTEIQIPNYLFGTRWLSFSQRDSFEFTTDSMFMFQDLTDVGKGVGLRAYGYKLIEPNKIDMEESYLKWGSNFQDTRSSNQFYPYVYYIRIENDSLYQTLNNIEVLWGVRIN